MLAVAVQAGCLALGRSPGRVKGPPASGDRTWDARQLDAAKPDDVELAQVAPFGVCCLFFSTIPSFDETLC